jgi:hypothetical protein
MMINVKPIYQNVNGKMALGAENAKEKKVV